MITFPEKLTKIRPEWIYRLKSRVLWMRIYFTERQHPSNRNSCIESVGSLAKTSTVAVNAATRKIYGKRMEIPNARWSLADEIPLEDGCRASKRISVFSVCIWARVPVYRLGRYRYSPGIVLELHRVQRGVHQTIFRERNAWNAVQIKEKKKPLRRE